MRALGNVVRSALAGAFLLIGGLLVLVAVWYAVFTIVTPECSVDVDDPGGVLIVRLGAGLWVVLEIGWAVVASMVFRRSPVGWGRVWIAAAVPVGAVIAWIAAAGSTELLLTVIDAGEGSSACW